MGVRSPGHQECSPAPNPAAQLWSLSTHRRSVPTAKSKTSTPPTGKYAAFAYTAALNYLLADREHVYRLRDATVVCWAKGGGDDATRPIFRRGSAGAPTPLQRRGSPQADCCTLPRNTVDFRTRS